MGGDSIMITRAAVSVDLIILLVSTLWIGLLIGVCFIATPAKFQAQSLTLPIALDVGRSTFAVWNHIEWALLALTVPLVVFSQARLYPAMASAAVGAFLLVQTLVLLPALNNRIAIIIAGQQAAPSPDHLIYIAIDGHKYMGLSIRRLEGRDPHHATFGPTSLTLDLDNKTRGRVSCRLSCQRCLTLPMLLTLLCPLAPWICITASIIKATSRS